MEFYSNDQAQFKSKSLDYKVESPSSSSASSESITDHQSDEEVILASSRPKKRAGRRIFKETRHPIFRGVRRRNGDKWVCEVREPNKKSRIWLGTYPCPEMAARAHDVAALALRGKSACLNFGDSSWRLPLPDTSDAADIRRAAREAAEMFRPQEFGGEVGREKGNVEESLTEVCSSSIGDCRVDDRDKNVVYFDEDDVFHMPSLIADMAQGLLLENPTYQMDGFDWDGMDSNSDFSLWSY